ncbi:MAG TPA: hypothetical protein DCE08_02840 [Ruminococcaceae bacterium]|nr:hypothetical protein [Oscillospiraceae bacterium]
MLVDLLEALTIFCFGLSWPLSIRKSWVSRTAKGKSLFFEVFLLIGYACGIAKKIIETAGLFGVAPKSGFIFFLSFFFYVLNFIEISIDVGLYFRNKKLDEAADRAAAEAHA